MGDEETITKMNLKVYLNNKGREVLDKARRMDQNKARFIGILISRYGESYIAELKKQGFAEATQKKPDNAVI